MTDRPPAPSGRLLAVRILAAVIAASAIGFGLFTAIFGIVNPAQEPHAFHNAVVASLLIVLSAPPVIAIARSPERAIRPLTILAVVGVAAVATMAVALTPDPFTLPFVVLVGVLWALVPVRSGAFPDGRPSVPLLALAIVAVLALAPYALEQAGLQRSDHASEHAAFFHWVEMAFYATAIPLLALLAAVRPRDYRPAAWASALALAILGVASLAFPAHASAVAAPWSWAAIAGSILFLVVTEIEVRRAG